MTNNKTCEFCDNGKREKKIEIHGFIFLICNRCYNIREEMIKDQEFYRGKIYTG